MINDLSELKPYKSLLLGRVRDGKPVKRIVDDVLDELEEIFAFADDGARELISRRDEAGAGDLLVGYFHYVEEQRTPWTSNPEVLDRVNQLVLVCRRNRHLAIYLSDTSWRSAIVKSFGLTRLKGLGALQKIAPGLLNAAFVKGAARTLWLSGAHARTSIKADNKILSGIELQDALDPLADQTYYFTAARCASDFDPGVLAVGTSPRGSRVWIGTSRGWEEFQQPVTALLKHLEGISKPEPAPIPIVAVSSVDTGRIENAFDLAVAPPELLSDEPSGNEQTREEMEQWSYYTSFKILETSKADLTAEAVLRGTLLGTVEFKMDLADPENIKWQLSAKPASGATREDLERLVAVCYRPSWVKIWYESGHTISDGRVIEVRHRDVPFNDFVWVDFSKYNGGGNFKKYDITKEKPSPLDLPTIGNQDSLFCWVRNSWPVAGLSSRSGGWLACDDGAGEIADFIHLDDASSPPKLSLIHVKGAGSAEPTRDIAVAKYELVTAQAIKNLRSLDRILLADGMKQGMGRAVKDLVWHDRKPSSRNKMLAALEKIGSSFEREVIILQPHLIKARVDSARTNPKGPDPAKLRQFDTLLLAQANSCHGLQARLRVVSADGPNAKLPASKKRKK